MTGGTVLFDLDGTLTDPGLGITNAILYAFREMGLPPVPRETLYPYIGPPLIWSFQTFAHMDLADARRATALYRAYYADRGKSENAVYPGTPQALRSLGARGYRLAVATSKPEDLAREVLELFRLTDYFDFVAGRNRPQSCRHGRGPGIRCRGCQGARSSLHRRALWLRKPAGASGRRSRRSG